MMSMRFLSTNIPAVLAVTGLAISSTTAHALQSQNRDTQASAASKSTQESQHRTYVFRSAAELLDQTLKNQQGEELASIDDFIIDRGTGRIASIVIQEGGFLGFGGSHVAIPMKAMTIDPTDGSMSLNVAPDLLEDGEMTLPNGWQRLDDDWQDELHEIAPTDRSRRQQLQAVDPETKIQRIRGTVVEVERVDIGETRHLLAVWVAEKDSDNQGDKSDRMGRRDKGQRVVLGPAWYAVGRSEGPVRGQMIEVRAFEGHGDMMHAKSARFDGNEVQYRSDKLEPKWTDRSMRSDSRRTPGQYALLSQIMDDDVRWGRSDEKVGEIDDALIEMTRGHVAALMVSPNGNWWGQDKGPRALPFDVARLGEEHITLDASREMMGGAWIVPEDLSDASESEIRRHVFEVFEVRNPQYDSAYRR